jgi:hypothetical protein
MLAVIRESDMPLAYEALLHMIKGREELEFIREEIRAHQTVERTRQDLLARDVVPEVRPVLQVSRVQVSV